MNETNLIGLYVSLTVLFALVSYAVFRYWSHRRKKLLDNIDKPEWIGEQAYNQILTTRTLIDRAEKRGDDVTLAKSRLAEAESRHDAGDHEHALTLARDSRNAIPIPQLSKVTRQRVPVADKSIPKEEILYRDVARGASEKEEKPAPLEDITSEDATGAGAGSMPEFRKKMARNYLEARFEMGLLEDALKAMQERAPEEAQKLLSAAGKAFEKEDYTESLRLALRGRRILGSPATDIIPLTKGTVVDAPPSKPLPNAMRSSAPQITPDVIVEPMTGEVRPTRVVCGKCEKDNPASNKFCRGCGTPLSQPVCPRCQKPITLEDAYCGTCGAPMSTTT